MEKTGFCWKCGKQIKEPVFIEIGFDGYLFCCKEHQEQYYKNLDRGKRDRKKMRILVFNDPYLFGQYLQRKNKKVGER